MKNFLCGFVVGAMLAGGGVFASSYHGRYATHDLDELAEDLHDLLDRQECASFLDVQGAVMLWCDD